MMVTSSLLYIVYRPKRRSIFFNIDLSDHSVYTMQEMSPSYNILYIYIYSMLIGAIY